MVEPLRRVGRYELLEVIGRGGAAVVYLARQPDLDRNVALKELSPHHAGDPNFAHRFVEESRLAAAMSHPSIVTVHEYFEHDGLPYIAMEHLPRGSLRPYLAALTLPQLAGMVENVLAGLAHGESHGIIHRDLKPENLLVAADGHVKIADFGVARALRNASPRSFATVTGTTIGTPAYMAPEQALGEVLSPATDLYSLGIIVWEALAGHTPFESRETPMAVLYRQVNDPVPEIDTIRPDVDPALSEWLATLLTKRPSDRFPAAEPAWDALEDVVIKLAGPRWRRQSRIRGELPAEPGPHPTPVTPTITDPPEPEPAPATDVRPAVKAAPAPSRRTPASPAPAASAAPVAVPRPRTDTVIRRPRRHDLSSEPAAEPAGIQRGRKPLLVAAIVAVIGAIVGGIVGGITASHDTSTRVTTTPATRLATSVRPILRTAEAAQRTGRRSLHLARTPSAQAAAARRVSRAFADAARQVQRLPRHLAQLPAARTLRSALAEVGDRWRSLAAAASRGSSGSYNAAVGRLNTSERRLTRATLTAERG